VQNTITYPTLQEIIDGTEILEELLVPHVSRQSFRQRSIDALEIEMDGSSPINLAR
jgi:hypothetical protein